MQKSADHLLTTTDSITATAAYFGFADATSFGRAFKRHFMMSPGQWRDAARQRGG
jgi:AraC-like DNA-binding protein